MNARWLIDGLTLLGDEVEIIQKFRKLVVGLAVSGKLNVAGEPSSDPTSLIKLIEERKHRLFLEGLLPKQKTATKVMHEDLPKGFSRPERFVRLGCVARIEKGLTGIQKAEPGPYPLVVTAEERASCDHFDFEGAAAIVPLVSSTGHGKASLQRLHYQEGKFALGSILAAVFPHAPDLISPRFLFEYLTAFKEELLVAQMIGTANVSLSVGKISEVPVPLVSPSIQRKVDELMTLCDQLEATRAKREATRDRLTAATLVRFNTPDPVTFRDDVSFALKALPALTTRSDQLKHLRQTILNLAVRGQLVQQDPNDEPASELLKRIAEEIADYSKEKRIGLTNFEPPFSAPLGWEWTRLCGLFRVVTDGDHQPPPKADVGVAFLTIGNITTGKLDFSNCRLVSKSYYKSLPAYKNPKKG